MNTLSTYIIIFTLFVLSPLGTLSVDALEYDGTLIKLGSQGPQIEELQRCLLDMEFTLPEHGVDGWYGEETRQAIQTLQSNNDLEPDGIVGPLTAMVLTCGGDEDEQDDETSETDESTTDTGDDTEADSELSTDDEEGEEGSVVVTDVALEQDNDILTVFINGEHRPCTQLVRSVYEETETGYSVTLGTGTLEPEPECDDEAEAEAFERELDIDISTLLAGTYELVVNDDTVVSFEVKPRLDSDVKPEQRSDNTSAELVSSEDDGPMNTAKFGFKMNVKALENPLYVPVSALAAGDIRIIDINMEDDTESDTDDDRDAELLESTFSLESDAPVIVGRDDNEYYVVETEESFTFRARVTLDPGTYYAYLKHISFTSRDVTSRGYEGFIGLNLELNKNEWKTDEVEVE